MKIRIPFDAALGISVEILYTAIIMLAAYLLCLLLSLR